MNRHDEKAQGFVEESVHERCANSVVPAAVADGVEGDIRHACWR